MTRFVLGFASAVLLMFALWFVDASQLLKDPIPLTGEQFREEWGDTAKDSQGHWVLTIVNPNEFVLELRYPIKRYKFVIGKSEISINRPIIDLPMNLQSGDVVLSSDPDHPLVR